MSTIELPDDIAEALSAAARARGISAAGLIAELVAVREPDALDALMGVGSSGRTDGFDIHAERAANAERHNASTI